MSKNKSFADWMRVKEDKLYSSLEKLKHGILVATDRVNGGIRAPGMSQQDERIVKWAQFNEPGIKRYLYPGFGAMAAIILEKVTSVRSSSPTKFCALMFPLAYLGFLKARLEHRNDCIRKVIVSNSQSTYVNNLRAKYPHLYHSDKNVKSH